MSEMADLYDYENRDKKKNPFRSKPIPKGKIEWAINSTQSIRAAAQFLGVAYNTFKKYAKKYDLFEQNKNKAGVGVTTKGNTGWGIKIQDIFDGKNPKYPHWKLQERMIRDGYLKQECSNCGYNEIVMTKDNVALLIDFKDGDSSHTTLENIRLLCPNCYLSFNGHFPSSGVFYK